MIPETRCRIGWSRVVDLRRLPRLSVGRWDRLGPNDEGTTVGKKGKKAKRAKKDTAEAAPDPKATPGSKQVWKLMDRGSTVAAGVLARQASELTWKVATGKKPPSGQKNPESNLREVAVWAFVGGGLTELVRVLVKRSTATYWVRSTGHLPPGMKHVKTAKPEDQI